MGLNSLNAIYEKWDGKRTTFWQRFKFFFKDGVKKSLRSKWAIIVLLITYMLLFMPRIFEAVLLPIRFEPIFYYSIYDEILLFMLLFAAIIGSGAIANDMKNKSIVLYFTKGFSKTGYVVGKFIVLLFTFSFISIVPFIVLFLVSLVSSTISFSIVRDNIWVLGACIATGLIISILFVSLSMGLSSILGDKRYAGAAIFVIFILSQFISEIMFSLNQRESMYLFSLWNNVTIIGSEIFGFGNPYDFHWIYPLAIVISVILLMMASLYYVIFRKEAV